jgi:hypothetical protein
MAFSSDCLRKYKEKQKKQKSQEGQKLCLLCPSCDFVSLAFATIRKSLWHQR